MKTYTRHNCDAAHRSPRTFMKFAIRRAEWVTGDGEYAVIAWCRVPTVTLWTELERAQSALELVNDSACGGRCFGRHDLVRVVLA